MRDVRVYFPVSDEKEEEDWDRLRWGWLRLEMISNFILFEKKIKDDSRTCLR